MVFVASHTNKQKNIPFFLWQKRCDHHHVASRFRRCQRPEPPPGVCKALATPFLSELCGGVAECNGRLRPVIPVLAWTHCSCLFSRFSSGEKWKTRRRMLTPTFHFRILHDFLHVFNDQCKIFVQKLRDIKEGQQFDIFPYISTCTLDIICGECL